MSRRVSWRDESGQALSLVVLALLLSLAALVVDVGSWYVAQRKLQNAADAAALAAVYQLPENPREAAALATRFADANGGALAGPPAIERRFMAGDTVTVQLAADAPVFFARLVGVESVTIHAHASARVTPVERLPRVVPIGVSADNDDFACGSRCYGDEITLAYDNSTVAAPGAFGFLDLSNASGAIGTPTLAEWVASGFPDEVGPGLYDSEPGNRWQSGPVRDALDALAAAHTIVLLPVFDGVSASGAQARYDVVGFAAFRVDAYDPHGDDGSTLTGAFLAVVRRAPPSPGGAYFGVKTASLVG